MSTTHPRGRRRRSFFRLLIILVLAIVAIRLLGPRVLQSYARGFIVADSLLPCDAVVALAGGDGERLHAAIELYKRGLAPRFLITGPDTPLLPVYTGGDSLTQAEVKRRIAVKRGIPAEAIVMKLEATSTIDEAKSVLAACREQGWHSVLVVTSPFHTRRSRATFHSVLKGSGVEARIWHLPLSESVDSPRRWWTREDDTMSILTETVKTLFYVYNYRIYPWS